MLSGRSDFLIMISTYCVSYCFVSAITYLYVDYSLSANKHFRRLQNESSKDFLTGLNNVRQFDSVFNDAIKYAREKHENLSLLIVDIDFFKKVNDTYGHMEGDNVLKDLGKILAQSCRSKDEVSRNGGEEFTLLLYDCPNSKAVQIAQKIRTQVEAHPFVLSNGLQISITVSIGVSSYPETTNEIEKLIEKADSALYNAKRTGRNKVSSL
jgi:diguanylate cyclase